MLLLIDLYRTAEDYFFRSISSKCLSIGKGVNAYMTGAPVADLNLVYITKNANGLERTLRQNNHFFGQYNLPFVVIIPQDFCTAEVEDICSNMHYHQTGNSFSMFVKLDNFKTASADTSGETLVRATNDRLNDWIRPLIGAFESTLEISSAYATAHRNALKKNINLRHFSLYKQGIPIASITLSMQDTVARIDDVGVLPEFQGKGYATHLMHHVLLEAKRLGARHCFLEASESGLSLYQNLGFEPLFKNNIYSRKA